MKVNDIVLFNLQECKVLEVNGERAILYAPLKAEPYLVVFVKDCTPLYKKEGKLNSWLVRSLLKKAKKKLLKNKKEMEAKQKLVISHLCGLVKH